MERQKKVTRRNDKKGNKERKKAKKNIYIDKKLESKNSKTKKRQSKKRGNNTALKHRTRGACREHGP